VKVAIGKVGRPHGIDGAFFVEQPSDDVRWWKTGARFLAGGTPVEVVAHRTSSGRPVIKVEPPGGDMLRVVGPGGRSGAGPLFLNVNRNKRSIVLDLKRPAGKEALLKLAQTADALVYNVRPQAMKRLGLDYEAVRQMNARIIYVGTFGFSQRGRYADLRAFDDLIQAAVAIPEASVRAGSRGCHRLGRQPSDRHRCLG